eukprot:168946-Hanusia_phi.AAC.1
MELVDLCFRLDQRSSRMIRIQDFLQLFVLTALVSCAQASTCFDTPSQPPCSDASAFYSSLYSDLASACQTWSYASGCSIRTACKDGKVTGPLCNSWSLLIEVCSDPIVPSTDSSCLSYHKLCDPADSVVAQCNMSTVRKFLQTQTAIDDMMKLCNEMPDMPQCLSCMNSTVPKANCPDPFLSVSQVCQSMWMTDCQHWYDMCKTQPVAFSYFCGSMSPSILMSQPTTSQGVQDGKVCLGKMMMAMAMAMTMMMVLG